MSGWSRFAVRATVAVAALILSAAVARAQTCSFSAASGVSFGSYDALETSPLDQTGSITFQCTGLGAGTVTVDLSTGISGTYAAREMRKGTDSLEYNLYRNAARTLVWGNGTGGTSHFGPFTPADGMDETVTIFGRIPARQASPVGAYSATVTVTINF
jgi:spore coat protein U-like protein